MGGYSFLKVESGNEFFRRINSFLYSFSNSSLKFKLITYKSGFFQLIKSEIELFVIFDFEDTTLSEIACSYGINGERVDLDICNFEEFKKQVKEILE